MEVALFEAAAPPGLYFDAEKSRLILDPLISRDPGLKLASENPDARSRDAMLWSSVTQTAKRQAEEGSPAAAMEWLGTLPFASQGEYAKAASEVLQVWKLKSESEASAYLQKSSLPPLK
jgi:hypothetical protein